MKTVLLLTQFFPPETGAGANRIGPMAAALSKRFDLRVVALKASYPSPAHYDELSLEHHDESLPYPVRRTFNFSPHKGSLMVRSLREQLMSLRLVAHALTLPADVVVTSSPSMFLGPAALVLAKLKRAKFVWDVRDITWGYARDVAGASSIMSLGLWSLEKLMLLVARRADLITGASSGIRRVLIEGGASSQRVVTIPNGISTELLHEITRETRSGNGRQRPVVTYAGVVGHNQKLEILLEVARSLPEVDFVVAGEGPELPLLRRRAVDFGLRNVSFRGYLNRPDLLKVYKESDILFAHARSTPTIDATMIPVKLFEYMAAGRPIVYAGRGIAAEFLNTVGCAITVPPEDAGSAGTAISKLLNDPVQLRVLGIRGRTCVEQDFHRESLMEEMASTLDERLFAPNGSAKEDA